MNRGAVLILVFIIMVALTAITGAFLYMTTFQTESSGYDISSTQAFWIAEGGLQKYFLRLRDGTYGSTTIPDLNENLGDGSYSVTASYDDSGYPVTYTIASTGTVDSISRKLQMVIVETSATLARGIHADGAHLKFNDSSGTVNGNVSCFVSVQPDPLPAGMTITGTVTDGADQPKIFPALTLTTYEGLADAAGQKKANWTFDNSQTWTGIWYITNKATIESNARIEGSVISEKSIDFENSADNVFIDPTLFDPSENYPALYAGSDLNSSDVGANKVGLQNSTINGLVFVDNNLTFDYLSNTTFNGTIIAGNNIDMQDAFSFTVNYDADIFSPMPPGFTFKAGTGLTVLMQRDWDEVAL